MNTPNPLHPQGAFLENRGRSQVRIAVFSILAVHVVLLGALLLQGCKRTTEPLPAEPTNAVVAPIDLPPITPPPAVASNPPVVAPPVVVTPPPVVNPPPVIEPTPPTPGSEHVILKGDTFGKLAKQYKVTVKAIVDANPGVDSTRLKIGQKIKIPPPSTAPAPSSAGPEGDAVAEKTYTVKSGDNLMRIAKLNGVTVKQLRVANNLKTDQIKVGQKLKIPAKSSAPAATAAPSAPAEAPPAATTLPPLSPPILPATSPSGNP